MLTLQNLLESDSLSTIVAKLNNNFQVLALSGGGPMGIRGEQGIPGLPGKAGPPGSTGPMGPTGCSTYIIPFATGTTSTIGPTSVAGPWPLSSYNYLINEIGGSGSTGSTGPIDNCDIFIDHYNNGYWKYLDQADATGQYANVGPGYPPTGTGYWGGPGWYFYPVPSGKGGGAGDLWDADYTTYFQSPTWASGPWYDSATSPLDIPNARFRSKYGTVWITAGNSGNTGATDYDTSTVGSWGAGYRNPNPSGNPQPGRWNSGIDRLTFKMSVDSVPYHAVAFARGITALGLTGSHEDPNIPSEGGFIPISGINYWVTPMYNTSLDEYTPLFFWSELRENNGFNLDGQSRFASLGLYQYTAYDADSYGTIPVPPGGLTAGNTGGQLFWNDKKSLFLLSSRLAPSPEDYQEIADNGTSTTINSQKTINLSELVLDVKTLTTTNQVVCTLPQDLRMSSDYAAIPFVPGPGTYDENSGSNAYKYRVFQGFISSSNGRYIANPTVTNAQNYIDFGSGLGSSLDPAGATAGNQTRRSWYGSAFRFDDVAAWATGSSDPLAEGYVRLAGMTERGKKTWDSGTDDTYFLSELIFYSSQFKVPGGVAGSDHVVSSQDIDGDQNEQSSLPVFYASPFRNLGIGTFTSDEVGVWEPSAKLHAHVNTGGLTAGNDPAEIFTTITVTDPAVDVLVVGNTVTKVAAFSAGYSSGNLGFIDFYLGKKGVEPSEWANPYISGSSPITPTSNPLRIGFRREGWYTNSMDSFRLGVQSYLGTEDIGQDLDTYRNEYQFAIHPLNKNASNGNDPQESISGVGIHNLWPRTRFHIYGKNKYNEADRGFEVAYPGLSAEEGYGPTGVFPYYVPNYKSSSQIVADYIADSYLYPTGILEYDYITYGGSPFAGVGTANVGTASPNAANYPSRDQVSPTRHYVPYGLTGAAGSLYAAFWNSGYTGVTGVSGAFNNSFRHDGLTGASYKPAHYLGFNIFRDLTNVGDNKDTTTSWVIGTNGGLENGGSLILTNNEGDFAIASIRDGRSGGESYAYWEQKVSTRDILNNIKVIVKKDGSVGFGNAAGYDQDAYSSQERDITTGYINYVPWSNKAGGANSLNVGPYSGGWASSYTLADYVDNPYGYVNYVGISGDFAETSSVSYAALINERATTAETIKAEFAADKLHGRPGRTLHNGGWGYPIGMSLLEIPNPDVRNYVILTSAFSSEYANIEYLTLESDFEGRLTQAYLTWSSQPGGATAGTPISDIVEAIVFPHPIEFENGNPLNTLLGANFTAPIGAAAAAWDSEVTEWNNVSGAGYGHYIAFSADPLILGNVRLNNFVAGEGYGVSGGNLSNDDITAIKEARQSSPKLIFTFMEGDNTNIPGQLDVYAGTPYSRPTSGTEPYRKVNTVIASAQNESSLREYWIPKSDNSGGTFMVFTDHYGQKEKDSHGLDNVTINMDRMLLEEVVTLEFIYGYTGVTAGYPAPVTGASTNGNNSYGASGSYGGTASFPAHVLYKNRNMLEDYWPYYGYTGPLGTDYQEMFASNEYAKVYTLGPSNDNPGFYWPGSGGVQATTDLNQGTTGSTVIRNIDKFYSIYNPSTNYENGWGDPNISNKASEFRFRRINTDFALVDFNITVSVRNPNLDTGIAYGEPGSYEIMNQAELIDRSSPRLTQFIRMKYFPSAGDTATFGSAFRQHQWENLFLTNLFGNGLNFANWSAYRNWYPGVAVVGPDSGPGMTGTNTTTATGEPHYMDNSAFVISGACEYYNRWNGNLINYGAPQRFIAGVSTGELGAQISALTFNNTSLLSTNVQKSPTHTWTTDGQSGVTNFPDWYMYSQPGNMFGDFGTATDRRGAYFSTYMGKLFQLMGNRGFSRTRNCMWRIVPEFGNYYNDLGGGSPTGTTGTVPRNTFVLEVMFDDPILHVDTPFRDSVWGGASSASETESSYFKYLTLSGQSILRFVNQPEYSWTPETLPPAPGSTGSAGPCAPPPVPEVQIVLDNDSDINTGFDTDIDWIKVNGITATYVSGTNYPVTPGANGIFKTDQLSLVPPGVNVTAQLTSYGTTGCPVTFTDTDSVVQSGTGPVGTTQILTFSGVEIMNPGSSQSNAVLHLLPPEPVEATVIVNCSAVPTPFAITNVTINGQPLTPDGVSCIFPISQACPQGYFTSNQVGTYDIVVTYSNPSLSSPRIIKITASDGTDYCQNANSGSGTITFTGAAVNPATAVLVTAGYAC